MTRWPSASPTVSRTPLVELDVLALEFQCHELAGAGSEIAHQPGEAGHQPRERHHGQTHRLGPQARDPSRVVLDQFTKRRGSREQGLQPTWMRAALANGGRQRVGQFICYALNPTRVDLSLADRVEQVVDTGHGDPDRLDCDVGNHHGHCCLLGDRLRLLRKGLRWLRRRSTPRGGHLRRLPRQRFQHALAETGPLAVRQRIRGSRKATGHPVGGGEQEVDQLTARGQAAIAYGGKQIL